MNTEEEEKKSRYKRLLRNIQSIYYLYTPTIQSVDDITDNTEKGLIINEKIFEKYTISEINDELYSSKTSIRDLIQNIEKKIED